MVKKYSVKRGMKKYVSRKTTIAKKHWGQKVLSQKIQLSVPVYAVDDGVSAQFYSFQTGSTPRRYWDINVALGASSEYNAIKFQYACFKINGISVLAENVIGNTVLTSAPPAYFMFSPAQSSFPPNGAVYADNNYKVYPLGSGKNKGKYFNMSEPSNTSAGYPLTGLWRDTTLHSSSTIYMMLGNDQAPVGLASGTSVQICSLAVVVYCQFGIRTGA